MLVLTWSSHIKSQELLGLVHTLNDINVSICIIYLLRIKLNTFRMNFEQIEESLVVISNGVSRYCAEADLGDVD